MILNYQSNCIVSGRLLSDAETTRFGAKNWPKARFAVIYADKKKGSIIDCEALFEMADACKNMKKNDRVIVAGVVEKYETKNGEQRQRLLVDAIASAGSPAVAKSMPVVQAEQTGFTDIDDDELPF